MSERRKRSFGIPPAATIGCASLASGAALFPWSPGGAAGVWGAFVLLCAVMPWIPSRGFFLPVASHGPRYRRRVSLTFDDGPDEATTPLLLPLLERWGTRATFFVVGERARTRPALIRQILSAGHSLGNHSDRHDVLLMLRSSARLRRDIASAQAAIEAFGIRPRHFRPPAGITNPRLGPILSDLSLTCVTFSCRSWDGGNRRLEGMAGRVLRKVRAGDILVFHDCRPRGGQKAQRWLAEIDAVMDGLRRREFQVVPLDDLLSGDDRGRCGRRAEGPAP